MSVPDLLALVTVLAGCALLWPASRRLGLSTTASAIAVATCVVVAVPVAAVGAADAAASALVCLLLAVAVTGPDMTRRLGAAGLALAGLLCAPVAAVGLLAGAACLLASPGSGPELSPARRYAVLAAGLAAAIAVAVPATGSRPWAIPPDPGTSGGGDIGMALVLAFLLALSGLTWARLPWVRPIAAGATALAVCALVPGTAVAALVLVAPLLAVLTAAALTEIPLPSRWRRLGGALGALVLVVATAPLIAGGTGAAPGAPAAASPGPAAGVPAAGPPAAPERVRPVRVTIPALNVDSALVDLYTDRAGVLLPPDRPDVAGWFAGGPVPGDVGPAVIGGHVDSEAGPGVFLILEQLREGDQVLVDRSDGTTARFEVRAVSRVPKDRFPTERVYGPAPGPELRLVTCGGTFDQVAQSYRDNVVVEAIRVWGGRRHG